MKSIVIYASRYGNTYKVAEEIAAQLRLRGEVALLPTETAPATFDSDVDLVVIGGPTEGHGMTPPMRFFLGKLYSDALAGKDVAAFDTRLHGKRWLTGSAADGIAHRLEKLGAHLVVPPESFEVAGKSPVLAPGELLRARAWAAIAADAVRKPAAV